MKKMFSFKGKITETDDKTKQEQKKTAPVRLTCSRPVGNAVPNVWQLDSQGLGMGFPDSREAAGRQP